MDVFLFPSLFEGLPVSLVEAQASGIHSVISDGVPKEAILIPEQVTVVSLKNPLLHGPIKFMI
jgi:glycosyltransferase involved in cell wall biosynthesis